MSPSRPLLGSLLPLAFVGCAAVPPSRPVVAPAPATPAPEPRRPDYLVVAPRDFAAALAPLMEHRRSTGHEPVLLAVEDAYVRHSDGRPDAEAIRQAIATRLGDDGGALRFVLLVGDVPRDDEPPEQRVATFYLPKLDYHTSYHRELHPFHRSLLHVADDECAFPSDHPFALPAGEGGARLAVGRVPARTAEETAGFVTKIIRYETSVPGGTWPRRLVLRAGPANFGPFIDSLLEQTALGLLDESVPYEYDLEVTFAKPGSRYAYRYDRLGDQLTEQANRGAFLLAYVGHSSPAYFATVPYRDEYYGLGSRTDFERMKIADGAPIFLSLSCDVGAFDMSQGRRSIAEEAALNPDGPIAAFAASRESHPYGNLLYGQAFIAAFLEAAPATIGEGIAEAERRMLQATNLAGELLSSVDGEELKREHAALYNLFGDPATRLRYPGPLSPRLAPPGPFQPGDDLRVELGTRAPGEVVVTLETMRRAIAAPLVPDDEIARLPLEQAMRAIADNHARSNDKVLARVVRTVGAGATEVVLAAPTEPGDYVVKAYWRATNGAARWGHVLFAVRPRP